MSTVSLVPTSGGGYGVSTGSSSLLRVAPEPRSSLGSLMQSVATTGLNIAQAIIPGGDVLGTQDLTGLLTMQMQIQQEMQMVSMISNVERSKHETEMAPIRNMRLG